MQVLFDNHLRAGKYDQFTTLTAIRIDHWCQQFYKKDVLHSQQVD